MERNSLTERQAEDRINSQITNEERTKHAAIVIDTNRPKEDTEKIVLGKFEELKSKLDGCTDFSTLRAKSKM